MKIGKFYVVSFGIEFLWHGDAVVWVWPWRRGWNYYDMPFYSHGFADGFPSLKAIDDEWAAYEARVLVAPKNLTQRSLG